MNRQQLFALGKVLYEAILGFGKVFLWLTIILIVLSIANTLFTSDRKKLADQYKIPQSQVFVTPKPHGCDFNDAPLGNKHCHFEKKIDVERACGSPNCNVTSVYVSWLKVEDE